MFFDEEELLTLEQAQAEAQLYQAEEQTQTREENQVFSPAPALAPELPVKEKSESRVSQDIETILYKAQLYRQFLGGGSIFDGYESDITKEVEEEFAEFAQDRLCTLLGLKQNQAVEVPQPQFEAREVEVLKLLARKLSTGSPQQQEKKPPPPVAQRAPVKQPEAPTIRRTKIQPPKQAQQKPAKQQATVPPVTPPVTTQPPKQVVKSVDKNIAPKEGDIIEEDGKRFKITWLPVEASAKLLAEISNIQDGIAINTPEGQLVKSGGGLHKVLRREMRKNLKTGGVPMPTGAGFELAIAQQTQSAVSSLDGRKLF